MAPVYLNNSIHYLLSHLTSLKSSLWVVFGPAIAPAQLPALPPLSPPTYSPHYQPMKPPLHYFSLATFISTAIQAIFPGNSFPLCCSPPALPKFLLWGDGLDGYAAIAIEIESLIRSPRRIQAKSPYSTLAQLSDRTPIPNEK